MKAGDRDLEHAWRVPWQAQTLSSCWNLDSSRSYRFSPQPAGTGHEGAEGEIAFDFAQQRYGSTNDAQRAGEITPPPL